MPSEDRVLTGSMTVWRIPMTSCSELWFVLVTRVKKKKMFLYSDTVL